MRDVRIFSSLLMLLLTLILIVSVAIFPFLSLIGVLSFESMLRSSLKETNDDAAERRGLWLFVAFFKIERVAEGLLSKS